RGGAGDPRAPPREHAAVRHSASGHGYRDRHGVRRDDHGPGLRGGARRSRDGLGQPSALDRDGRLDPARECPAGRRSEGGDRAHGDDGRLRQHPCAERARAGRRVREGGGRRGGVLRPLRRALGRWYGKGGIVSAAAVPEGTGKPTLMERILNGIETAGNKMPNPAILFLALCVIVILLSQALYWLDVKATYQ